MRRRHEAWDHLRFGGSPTPSEVRLTRRVLITLEGNMWHVHFIAREYKNVKKVGPKEWESGDWYASARHPWVGARIHLHEAKADPSYLGGTIVSFRRLTTGKAAGRLVFRFREDPDCSGVVTSRCRGDWAQEKKYCG